MGMIRLEAGQMSTSMHRFPSLAGQEEPRVMLVGTAADGEGQGQASLWRLQTHVVTSDDFLTQAVQRGSHAVFMATATSLQQEDHRHASALSVPILWVIYLNAEYYTSVFAHGVEYFSTLNVSSSCYYDLEIFRDRDSSNNSNNVLSFRSSDDNTNNNNGSADNTRVDDDDARRVNDDRDEENSAVDDTALLEGHDELTRRRRRLSNNNNAMIHDNNSNNNNSRTASSPTDISSLQTVVLNLETAQMFSSRNLRIHTVNSQGQVSSDFDPFEFDDQRWDSKDDDDTDDDDHHHDGHVTDRRHDDGAHDNRNNRNHHSLETIHEHTDTETLVDDRSRVNDAFRFDI